MMLKTFSDEEGGVFFSFSFSASSSLEKDEPLDASRFSSAFVGEEVEFFVSSG
jgi:hypothetical protein